jgi:membrane fusion protein, copper/silver efflux system
VIHVSRITLHVRYDASMCTLKVRLEANNPSYLLRAEMFVDVEVTLSYPPALKVPLDAELNSGMRKTVFVERTNGVFVPRTVQTGWRAGELVEIKRRVMAAGQRNNN